MIGLTSMNDRCEGSAKYQSTNTLFRESFIRMPDSVKDGLRYCNSSFYVLEMHFLRNNLGIVL